MYFITKNKILICNEICFPSYLILLKRKKLIFTEKLGSRNYGGVLSVCIQYNNHIILFCRMVTNKAFSGNKMKVSWCLGMIKIHMSNRNYILFFFTSLQYIYNRIINLPTVYVLKLNIFSEIVYYIIIYQFIHYLPTQIMGK